MFEPHHWDDEARRRERAADLSFTLAVAAVAAAFVLIARYVLPLLMETPHAF